jgi:hypothetical protein
VSHVIAVGSPVNVSDPEGMHPLVRSAFQPLTPLRRLRGGINPQCGSTACTCRFARTAFSTLPAVVRFTSIFSKSDEIVDWRSAIDPKGENLEVSGRHLGLIISKEVTSASSGSNQLRCGTPICKHPFGNQLVH